MALLLCGMYYFSTRDIHLLYGSWHMHASGCLFKVLSLRQRAALCQPSHFTIYIAKVYAHKFHAGIKTTPLAKYKEGILGTADRPGVGLPDRLAEPTASCSTSCRSRSARFRSMASLSSISSSGTTPYDIATTSRDRSNIGRGGSFLLHFYLLFYVICFTPNEIPARQG